ncbi:carbonic anhydrase 1 [Trichonephila clavata]|uniref:Carbonic anhydrase 1 n=1 Tax=Trichonephila clavata TaxID=2740835 RepID=A0A8X6FD18_TRICU|nr:carbonic anhydrase 1 [Trichonephila clavata]
MPFKSESVATFLGPSKVSALGTCVSYLSRSHSVSPSADFSWGYDFHNGPNVWLKAFPHAAGKMQSPVDIKTSLVTQDPQLLQRPLSWTYVPKNCKSLLNTGEGWKVVVEGQDSCKL